MYQDSTTNAAIIKEVWSARFYEVLRATLPLLTSITRDYEGEITDLGDIVNISTIPDFDEATELAEGAAGDTEAVTVSGQQLVINKRTYKDFKVTKTALKQSLPFMDSLREKAVYAINKRIQQVIIDNIVPSASNPDHAIAYDSGTTLALADLLEGKELLDGQNVDLMDRIATMGHLQFNDLFNITGFTSRDFLPLGAGSPLTSGQIETPVVGFTPKMTTVVGTTTYLFHPSFMTMAIQEQLNVEEFNLGADGQRGFRVNTDILWGLKQLSNIRVVTIG